MSDFVRVQGTKQVQSKAVSRASTGLLPNYTSGILPRLLDVKQAAFYLSLSTWTVRDLIASGKLKTVRIPHPFKEGKFLDRQLLDVRDLDAFIEKCGRGGA